MEEKNNIIVSVFLLTYNQEDYIANTIDCILKQKTDFRFQLIIGEDCSTDNTLTICKDFFKKNPEKIKLITSNENVGLIKNFKRTLMHCRGKYIAICDGDDYWIDDNKLQKQVDFLDKNLDYSIVYTLKKELLKDGTFQDPVHIAKPHTTYFSNLVIDNYIPSVTCLFINKTLLNKPPNWIFNFPYGDWPLYLWTLLDDKKIYFLKEITAVYRKGIGQSSILKKKLSEAQKVKLKILIYAIKDPDFIAKKSIIKKSIHNCKYNLMISYNREKQYFNGLISFIQLLPFYSFNKLFKMYFYTIYKSFH